MQGYVNPDLNISFISFINLLRRHPHVRSLPFRVCCDVESLPSLDALEGFEHQIYGDSLDVWDVEDPEALAILIHGALPGVTQCSVDTLREDFEALSVQEEKIKQVNMLLNELISWSGYLSASD
jgi:hypothetical protein